MKRHIVLSIVLISFLHSQTPYDSLYLKSAVYKNMTAMFALSKMTKADVVFLGNSITAGGNWGELLGRERIANRGISGDNTLGTLHRMQFVTSLRPKLCFIMTGINDLYADASVELIFKNYCAIIDTLRSQRIIPVIQSTLHVNPKWKRTEEKNPLVAQLNALLKEYAAKHSIIYIDVNAVLSSNGVLRDEFTTDGVHLTPEAYGVWRELLFPVLKQYGL